MKTLPLIALVFLGACTDAGVQFRPDVSPDLTMDVAAPADTPRLDTAQTDRTGAPDTFDLMSPDLPEGSPLLVLVPEEIVDFGVVAQGETATRTVTLYNAGPAPLSVLSVEVVENTDLDEFGLVANPDFPPSEGSGTGHIPGAVSAQYPFVDVQLTLTNLGPPIGQVQGTLRLVTDDPVQGERLVTLQGTRAGTGSCELVLTPEALDFGGPRLWRQGHRIHRPAERRPRNLHRGFRRDHRVHLCPGIAGHLSGGWGSIPAVLPPRSPGVAQHPGAR